MPLEDATGKVLVALDRRWVIDLVQRQLPMIWSKGWLHKTPNRVRLDGGKRGGGSKTVEHNEMHLRVVVRRGSLDGVRKADHREAQLDNPSRSNCLRIICQNDGISLQKYLRDAQ